MVTTTIIIITFVAGDEQYSNEARSLLVSVCVVYIHVYILYMPMYVITAMISYHVNIKHIIIIRDVFYSIN